MIASGETLTSKYRLLLLLLFIVAAVPRFYGLGTAALIDDEYYLAKSITFILDRGLPEFPNGGYYFRGVIQQYLTAPFLLTSLDKEAVLRFVPALCNLLCIPIIFMLTRKLGGIIAAFMAVIFFAFSTWEIEFARFARMYSPYQLLFFLYTYCLVSTVQTNCSRMLFGMYALSVLGLFVYEASAFLLLFNFIPWVLSSRFSWNKALYYPLAITFFIVAIKFSITPPTLTSPTELGAGGHRGLILFPPLLLVTASKSLFWMALFIPLLVGAFWIGLKVAKESGGAIVQKMLFLVSILVALLNQVALSVIVVFFALLFLSVDKRESLYKFRGEGLHVIAFIACCSVYWVTYGITANEWLGSVNSLDTGNYPNKFVQLAGVLFNFPQILPRVLMPLMYATPITTTIIFFLVVSGALFMLLRPQSFSRMHVVFLFVVVLSMLLVGLTGSFQKTTRYSFFVYPALLVLGAIYIDIFVGLIGSYHVRICVLVAATFMLIAEDYNWAHISSIAKPESIHRVNFSQSQRDHLLARRDFESPMRFINEHKEAGDLVISSITPGDFYLDGRLDYMFIPKEANRFWERTVQSERGLVDVWNNASLLYDIDSLDEVVDSSAKNIWLVAFSKQWNGQKNNLFRDRHLNSLVYTSKDETIDVFRIAVGSGPTLQSP